MLKMPGGPSNLPYSNSHDRNISHYPDHAYDLSHKREKHSNWYCGLRMDPLTTENRTPLSVFAQLRNVRAKHY